MIVTGSGPDLEDTSTSPDNLWCDIETHKFYYDLPELAVFLPAAFLNRTTTPPAENETVTEEVLDSELTTEDLEGDGM